MVQLFGQGGHDRFVSRGTGEEWLWGGQGTDRVTFSGNRADYTIVEDPFGSYGWTAVTHNVTGAVAFLISVEWLNLPIRPSCRQARGPD